MRETLLQYICCPVCGGELESTVLVRRGEQIVEGLLRCGEDDHLFPVFRSVPRLLPDAWDRESAFRSKYPDLMVNRGSPTERNRAAVLTEQTITSFGRQWTTFNVQRPEEDIAYFRSKTGIEPATLKGQLVLDAGCGGGRYSRIAGEAKATVIGIDMSEAVEMAAEKTTDLANVHIVQADVFNLPIRSWQFDFIFSIGVLHHTPDTKAALSKLIPLLNETGSIAIWLYPRWPAVFEIYNRLLRAVTTRMNLDTLHRFAVALEPLGLLKWRLLTSDHRWQRLLGQLLRAATIGVSYHPDREIRICDTFDWFAPVYQWHHTDAEVESWLREFALDDIINLSHGQEHYQFNYGNGVNFRARRGAIAGAVTS